jgi:hypothetical protein
VRDARTHRGFVTLSVMLAYLQNFRLMMRVTPGRRALDRAVEGAGAPAG